MAQEMSGTSTTLTENPLSIFLSSIFSPPWFFVLIIILCLIAAGSRFFLHFFQVYVFPHISLRRVAEEEHFLYSVSIVLAGAAAFTLCLFLATPAFDKVTEDWIDKTVQTETSGGGSPYIDVAREKAWNDLWDKYELVIHDNIVVLTLVPLLFWLLFMSLLRGIAFFFHVSVKYPHFMRTVAYNTLAFGAGSGLFLYYNMNTMANEPIAVWVTPLAFILAIYAVVHFFISLTQGLELAPVAIIVCLILTIAILAGIGYLLYTQYGVPVWTSFWAEVNMYNPAA